MCQTGYAVAIGRQYLPTVWTKVLFSLGESLVNQDTQRIVPDDGVVLVCLKPESSAYVIPPGGVITSVSGSLVIVDVVRVCVCKSSFLILTNCGRRNNKITNKQKRSSLLAVLATLVHTVLVKIKISI